MLNPVVIYTALVVQGAILMMVVAYVHNKFKNARHALLALQSQWTTAESRHAGFVDKAHEQISNMSKQAISAQPATKPAAMTPDARKQILAMGKRGINVAEIARACNLPEADVEVLLSMARLQR
jgi:hypothetical protein